MNWFYGQREQWMAFTSTSAQLLTLSPKAATRLSSYIALCWMHRQLHGWKTSGVGRLRGQLLVGHALPGGSKQNTLGACPGFCPPSHLHQWPEGSHRGYSHQACTWHQIGVVLGRAVDPLKGRASIQRHLQRLEEKPNRNLVKLIKDQDQVPLLEG